MKYFNFIAAILLSILYATGKIPPSERFNLWISIFLIPFAMVCNTILLVVTLIMRRKSALFYLVPMAIGLPFMFGTVGIKHLFRSGPSEENTFTVMSYNIGGFHMKPFAYPNTDSARVALKDMIIHPTSDIQCYQESNTFPWSKEFNIIAQLTANGTPFYFSHEDESPNTQYTMTGVLIVSKFPIISSGDLLASKNGFNRISYADVKIRKDTVRIINVHLESMGLSQYDPRNEGNFGSVRNTTRTMLTKLKLGVFERSRQMRQLAAFIEASPHPVICAGDFNDMPYSYAYQHLKKDLKNTFEESGKGFGFTYNGGTLKVLRIDNQFYSDGLRSVNFNTMDSVKFSDHFPIMGTYEISRNIP